MVKEKKESKPKKRKGGDIVTLALLKSFHAEKHLDSSQSVPPGDREGNAGTGAEVGMSDRHINSKSYQTTDLTATQAGFLCKNSTH